MNLRTKLSFYSAINVIFLLLNGCNSEQYGYPSEGSQMVQTSLTPLTQKRLEVIPFKDSRPLNANSDWFFLWLVPLFPYGFGDYQRPEKADFFTSISDYKFDPSRDLARAVSSSLEQSNIFSQVQYRNSQGKFEADYLLSGEIHSTRYTGRRISYCSSFLTVIWWTLGAPLGTNYNNISFTLTLTSKAGDIVWQYTGEESDYNVDWMYDSHDDCSMYPQLTSRILNKAVMDLYRKTLENPKILD